MKSMEPFITGFLEDNKYIGRPVDVMQMKDGSLLVSDDWNGAVYRITYGKQKVAASSRRRPSLRAKRSNPFLHWGDMDCFVVRSLAMTEVRLEETDA